MASLTPEFTRVFGGFSAAFSSRRHGEEQVSPRPQGLRVRCSMRRLLPAIRPCRYLAGVRSLVWASTSASHLATTERRSRTKIRALLRDVVALPGSA